MVTHVAMDTVTIHILAVAMLVPGIAVCSPETSHGLLVRTQSGWKVKATKQRRQAVLKIPRPLKPQQQTQLQPEPTQELQRLVVN